MIKKLFTAKLLLCNLFAFSQLMTVGSNASVTVKSQTLLYNGGGLTTTASSTVDNSGNIMISGVSGDKLTIDANSNFYLRYNGGRDYGQMYINGIKQGDISGKVKKEYQSDYTNGATGRQQFGLPFYNFSVDDLAGFYSSAFGGKTINLTNTSIKGTSGRFNPSSAFYWNNSMARFDQIAKGVNGYNADGTPITTTINPLTYYALPRRDASGAVFYDPTTKVTFSGIPASDVVETGINNVSFSLSGGYAGSFGTNGSAKNIYTELYKSYLDDPFGNNTNWNDATQFGKNLYQLANPFLTNIDLKWIATSNDTGNDGNAIANLQGVAYYGNGSVNRSATGTTYTNTNTIIATIDTSSGAAGSRVFQTGDVNKLLIKPMGAFMVKLNSNANATLDLTKTRRFKYDSSSDGSDASVNSAKGSTSIDIPADKIVKQVAVVMVDNNDDEIARTYYAVSPSAITGGNDYAALQAYLEDKQIYTKEESVNGGEDYNFTQKLYINEANEIGYKSKKIPLYINYTEQPYKLKFEVYEKGERMPDGLSNGISFYIKDANDIVTKISDGESIAMNGNQSLGLYYDMPEGTLNSNDVTRSQTIVAKKANDWVVRFAKDWKKASVEVYSIAGQLLNSKTNISTDADYVVPISGQLKSVFVVKATSDKGEVVVKKIIN